MADLARDELIKNIASLLTSGDYSDLVITCGPNKYKVHKAVVCSQSGFFRGAERFHAGKEAAEGKVDLPDDEPALIELLIQFLYEGEYDPKLPKEVGGRIPLIVESGLHSYHQRFPHTCEQGRSCWALNNSSVCPHHSCNDSTCSDACRLFICEKCTGVSVGTPDDLLLHAKMYELADKYDIRGLKLLSGEKFSQSCIRYWDNDVFPTALEHALSSTPEEDLGLRDVLCNTIVAHATLLEDQPIEEIIGHHGVFAYQLIKKQAAEVQRLKK